MHTDLENKTMKDLGKLRPSLDENPDISDNLKFLKGNHFDEGRFWVGPKIERGNPLFERFKDGTLECFVSSNAMKDVTERVVNAILGKDSFYRLVPINPIAPPNEEDLIDLTPEQVKLLNDTVKKKTDTTKKITEEANQALKNWYLKRDVKENLQKLLELALAASKARIRLFIPEGRLTVNKDGKWTFSIKKDLKEALLDLFIDIPEFEDAYVYTDRRTMREMGVYFYTGEEGTPDADLLFAEVVYLDDTGKTVIKVLSEKGVSTLDGDEVPETIEDEEGNTILKEVIAETTPLDLGGNLTIAELRVPLLLTEQIRSLQKQLNKTLTMLGHTNDVAGFPESVVINGQMPTKEVEIDGKQVKVPAPEKMIKGPGYWHWIQGNVTGKDANNNLQVTTPGFQQVQPAPVDHFDKSISIWWYRILFEVKQLYVLISGDATPSGESRKQALWDFTNSILLTIGRIEEIGAWLIETALKLACIIMGEPDKYKDYRVEFVAVIDLGPLTAEEKQFILHALAQGVYSLDRARRMLGIEDPEAEQEQWKKEQKDKNEFNKTAGGEILKTFTDGEQKE